MTEPKGPKEFSRPFPQVVEALLYILPDSNPNKQTLSDLLLRMIVEEDSKERQWRMMANALQGYMKGAPQQLKQRVIQVLRDPTEYRYILKQKEKAEMLAAGESDEAE